MKGRSMIWRHKRSMCVSTIRQFQQAPYVVVLLHAEQIGNLSIVSIFPSILEEKAHNCLYSEEQTQFPLFLQNSEQSPALSQDMEND